MVEVAERQVPFATAFDALQGDDAVGQGWVAKTRREAWDRFSAAGLPSARDEEWRFTSLAPVAAVPFERAGAGAVDRAALDPWLFDGRIGHQVVLVNGRLVPELSSLEDLPAGVSVRRLRERWVGSTPEHAALALAGFVTGPSVTPFVDLNAALVEDGVVIEVTPGAVVADPIHVLSVSVTEAVPVVVAPRIVVIAGERSQSAIVESYAALGQEGTLTIPVVQMALAPGAIVDHVKLQREPDTAFHLSSMLTRQERDSVLRSVALTLGGRIGRNDIVAVLGGQGAECTLNGLYVATGDSLADTHTTIDHAQPHCPSHEVYKGILGGRARAVFNGKIIVRPQAQKTDAKQTNRALLLTDEAQINTKPQLEIFADDVRCTHGAAIGQLDEDAMFYLRARGVPEVEARNLLIHAFAGDVLDGVSSAAVRDSAMLTVERRLELAHLVTG